MRECVCFSLLYTTLKVEENKQANEAQDHNSKDGEQCSNNEVSTLNEVISLPCEIGISHKVRI